MGLGAPEEAIVDLSCCDSISALQEEFLAESSPLAVINAMSSLAAAPEVMSAEQKD